MTVDAIVDLVVEQQWSKADLFGLRRKMFRNEPAEPEEEAYSKYKDLYEQITPLPTFDNLPTPIGALDKKRKRRKQAKISNYISGPIYKQSCSTPSEEVWKRLLLTSKI